MANFSDDQEQVVWLSIPVSRETAEMLIDLADNCHAEPQAIAASLLRDILADDAEAHRPEWSIIDIRHLH